MPVKNQIQTLTSFFYKSKSNVYHCYSLSMLCISNMNILRLASFDVDKKPSNYNRRRVDWVCVSTRQCSNYYNNYAINLHRKVYAGEKNQMLPRCRRPRVPWLACRKKVTKCREFFRIHIFYSYSPYKPSHSHILHTRKFTRTIPSSSLENYSIRALELLFSGSFTNCTWKGTLLSVCLFWVRKQHFVVTYSHSLACNWRCF